MTFVTYEQFGAKGDGVTDDGQAICAAHAYANENRLPVRTTADRTYYISGAAHTAEIRTDTDWGNSEFVIDDRRVQDRVKPVFRVLSYLKPLELTIPALERGQTNVGFAPGADCYVVVTEDDIRRYIRRGLNQNNGSRQTDNFLLKADGTIAHPLLWDFAHIDRCAAYPVDAETLHLKGGFFRTIANQAPSRYTYYARGLSVERSNVEISDVHHEVTGEGQTGAPYSGFLIIRNCSRVLVRGCVFAPHKIYNTIGSANLPVSMGSYDISVGSATDVTFADCRQHDILDTTRWGLIGSNFCKNITLDGCVFSRMDAHQGVYGYTIRNCILGHQGLNAIGSGLLTLENSELYGSNLISFRSDYGSTWDGDVVVKNVVWHPCGGRVCTPNVFGMSNDGQHDFGYVCSMPHNILLENVTVDDTHTPDGYGGASLFSNYNRLVNESNRGTFNEPFPYQVCEKLTIRSLTFLSGKPFRVSANPSLTPVKEIDAQR